MDIQFKLDPSRQDVTIQVTAPQRTPQVEELLRRLSALGRAPLQGWRGEEMTPLPQDKVVRCYAQEKRVYASLGNGDAPYLLRERLYELEELLDPTLFVRISNGEIVNLDQVRAVDLSLTGTIRMTLTGGECAYVSRRYVKKIKETLKLERRRNP